jgi:hypothetical protein
MPFKAFFLSLALTAASVGSVLADHAAQIAPGKVWVLCNQVGIEMIKAGAKESAEAVQTAIISVFQTGLCIQTANGFPITASREVERVSDYEGDIMVIVQVKMAGMAEDARIFSWTVESPKVRQGPIRLAPGHRQASLHFVSY